MEDVCLGQVAGDADPGVRDDVGLGIGRIVGGGETGLGCLGIEFAGLDGGLDGTLFAEIAVFDTAVYELGEREEGATVLDLLDQIFRERLDLAVI